LRFFPVGSRSQLFIPFRTSLPPQCGASFPFQVLVSWSSFLACTFRFPRVSRPLSYAQFGLPLLQHHPWQTPLFRRKAISGAIPRHRPQVSAPPPEHSTQPVLTIARHPTVSFFPCESGPIVPSSWLRVMIRGYYFWSVFESRPASSSPSILPTGGKLEPGHSFLLFPAQRYAGTFFFFGFGRQDSS